MSPRVTSSLGEAVTVGIGMFLLRRVLSLLPLNWAQESWGETAIFSVLFALAWFVISYVLYPRQQRPKAEAARRKAERAERDGHVRPT